MDYYPELQLDLANDGFIGNSPLAMGVAGVGQNNTPKRIDWNNSKQVYYETRKWMKFIAEGNKPVGTEYWNVADIYQNIEYKSGWKKFLKGGMQGRTSRSHYYPKAGLRIFVAETNLTKNYRANYIQGIIPNDEHMTITLYGTYSQSQGVIVSSFTNLYYYKLWKKYIGLK